MARFFLHVVDDNQRVVDREGTELASLEAAHREAEAVAREILVQDICAHRRIEQRYVELCDDRNEVLAVFHLRNLIE